MIITWFFVSQFKYCHEIYEHPDTKLPDYIAIEA